MRILAFAVVPFVLLAATARAQLLVETPLPVTVDERAIHASLEKGSTVVSVPLVSSLDRPVRSALLLEWMGTSGVLTSTQQELSVDPGRTAANVRLGIPRSTVWLRLRYTLTPDRADARAFSRQTGIVSLPYIADHVFEVKISYSGTPRRGTPLTVYAQAVHPVTRAPVPDIEWKALLSIGDTKVDPVSIVRHKEGVAEISFLLPKSKADPDNDDESGEVTVTGRRGDFEQTASVDVVSPGRLSARLQIDKAIYQPGQTIHIRALVTKPEGEVVEGAKVTVRITQDFRDLVHRADLVSSKFGIVHEDWTLPAGAELGNYQIAVTAEGDERYQLGSHIIRVSRYELPEFSVTAKPDRTAYLPGENPSVTVTGAHLFGKPVPKGHVRVTRFGEARWNPKTKQSETTDETVAEGEAGDAGSFVAHLDLREDWNDLDGQKRFEDLHFAAYYTDPLSKRTEQRKFDIRITEQSIHIYVIGSEQAGPSPVPVYISTDYPDGKPAQCDVEIRLANQDVRLRTNRFGVGKAYLQSVPEQRSNLQIRASDSAGKTGSWTEQYWLPGDEHVRVETDRTLYRTGEAASVRVSAPTGINGADFLIITAVADDRPVARQFIRLNNGKAQVVFPWQPEFRRTVTFLAWNEAFGRPEIAPGSVFGARTVIFPDSSDLRLTAAADRIVYRPGEKSTLHFHVSNVDGKPANAVIGLAVVDEAVIERARTDSDFGHRSWFSCGFCGDTGENEIGGVRLKDLYTLKPSTTPTPELDLVAEVLLARTRAFIGSESSEDFHETPRFPEVVAQIKQLQSILDRHFAERLNSPADIPELAATAGKDWTAIRDPWGLPYTARFKFERGDEVIEIVSSGPDKTPSSEDDYIAGTIRKSYFALYKALIEGVLKGHDEYPATAAEFQEMLRERGLLLETMRDPWGTPYRAQVDTRAAQRIVSINSAGPDRVFGSDDDFQIAGFSGAYFQRDRSAIAEALRNASAQPQTLEEFTDVLASAGVDVSRFRDAWGRPYRPVTRTFSRFADKIDSTTVRTFGTSTAAIRTTVTPVTEQVIVFALRSDGPDGAEGTWDDFDIASFPVVLKQESSAPTVGPARSATLLRGSGVIYGNVTDASGAVIPNARIILIDSTGESYETQASPDGAYEFTSVPAGVYSLRASSPGFRIYMIEKVPVSVGNGTAIDITLQVGSTSESVTVEAEALPLQTQSASVASSGPAATPRVRDYFPETLLWLPEVPTDRSGNASTPLTLADSVTTWKIAAFASTLDGRTAESESDIRTFQPFFLDFYPPPVLTDGDRIELPVTVRNYRDYEQKVAVETHPDDSMAIDGARTRQVHVAANGSVNVAWTVHAKGITDAAHERFSAGAGHDRDVIEKTIRIHPDGQEVTQTQGDLFTGHAEFGLTVPTPAITGASSAELRLYPNVASLLLESATAVLNAPHGCAEQTISTGYASLIAFRYSKAVGITDSRVMAKAMTNVTAARDGLARFMDAAGGVSYWSAGDADIAVTAYAIRFLLDASTFVPIDRDQLDAMVTWLEKQQQTNGSWASRTRNETSVGRQDVLLTSLVMRSLAAAQKAGVKVQADVMAAGWHQITALTDQIDEPYMLAQFILGALDSGDNTLLGDAAKRLAAAAHEESGGLYWDLRTNSPFYGWGTAGRFETTGLVISALSAWRTQHVKSPDFDVPIRRGLFFLLRNRDRFGSWSSTQATVNAVQAVADAAPALGGIGVTGGPVEIRSNGKLMKTISMPAGNRDVDPILIDVSALIVPGENHVELTSHGAPGSLVLTRLSSGYWLPWSQTKPRSSPELRLGVRFDRTDASVGAPVHCNVMVERVGFKGYGMMLAEVGLPPGADVDRASLQKIVDDPSLGISRYDLLPDRVVFYAWPKAGGTSFDFILRSRMPLLAKSAASVLYDYYNPEAISEVSPVSWHIE